MKKKCKNSKNIFTMTYRKWINKKESEVRTLGGYVDEVVSGIVTKVSKDMRVNFSDDCGRSESGTSESASDSDSNVSEKKKRKKRKILLSSSESESYSSPVKVKQKVVKKVTATPEPPQDCGNIDEEPSTSKEADVDELLKLCISITDIRCTF